MKNIELAIATCADVPDANYWLSARERGVLASMIVPKRVQDWRLGRWAAKRVARRLFPEGMLEIIAASDGAPILHVDGGAMSAPLSLSHSHATAIAVISPEEISLGCDIELIEPHSRDFVQSYFTDREQAYIDSTAEADQPTVITALWSAKESVLKATRDGLRKDTRTVEVDLTLSVGWQPFCARTSNALYRGVWRVAHGWIHTIAMSNAA